MYSIQWIDIATGWSERRAVLGRGYLVMQDGFRCILGRLPFPVICIHPDNDSAFFNHHMLRFWGERLPGVILTRSRPYQKNDNPHVEQKNRTLIRFYLGDLRLDTVAHVLAANLEALRDATNPRQLRQEIYNTVDEIVSLPTATPAHRESVFDTLSHSVAFENAADDPLDFGFRRTDVLDQAD